MFGLPPPPFDNPSSFEKVKLCGPTPPASFQLPQEGKIREWGVSNETTWGVAKMEEAARKLGVKAPVAIQNDGACWVLAYWPNTGPPTAYFWHTLTHRLNI